MGGVRNLKGLGKMTPAAAEEYVRNNITRIPMPTAFVARNISCIDGRCPEQGCIRFPGGALGVVATILAAINREFLIEWKYFDDQPRLKVFRDGLPFWKLMDRFEQCLGGMSCHDDDGDHGKGDSELACAGCGHAKLILADERYHLGEYSKPLLEYARDLKLRHIQGDKHVTVPTYSGTHREQAVIRIKGKRKVGAALSLRPTDGKTSVFVVHEDMGLAVLRATSVGLYYGFPTLFEEAGITKSELLAHVKSMYFRHLRLSAHRLAGGLPVYKVSENGAGIRVAKSHLRF